MDRTLTPVFRRENA